MIIDAGQIEITNWRVGYILESIEGQYVIVDHDMEECGRSVTLRKLPADERVVPSEIQARFAV